MALGYFRRGGIVFAASGNLHQTLAWVYVTKAAIWWLRKRHFRQLSAIFMQSGVENSRKWTDSGKDRPAQLNPFVWLETKFLQLEFFFFDQ